MSLQASQTERWKQVEPLLAVSLVLLKLHVLYDTWGRIQGFDPGVWLDVVRLTHWFDPLVSAHAYYGSFHPPLSYLLGRAVLSIYPHEVEASQILSTLSLLGAFFVLRSIIRRIGWLHTLPGLWVLYGGMSVPLIVWLTIETSYDPMVFFWFLVALAMSISLFWTATTTRWWKNSRFTVRLTLLGLVYAASLLTKYNLLVAIGLPLLIILIRRGPRAVFREMAPPVIAALIGIIIVAPLYYKRYYLTEGSFMPTSMDWIRADTIRENRAQLHAHPLRSLGHVLRIPEESITKTHTPVMDSFIHSEWLEIWKRDSWIGGQAEFSTSVSNFYIVVFPAILGIGTLLFLVRNRRIPKPWRQLGWALLSIALIYSAAAISFAWRYPVWDWRVFKAKYNSPAVLWIPYATAVAFSEQAGAFARVMSSRWAVNAAFLGLVLFMMTNHLVPVY